MTKRSSLILLMVAALLLAGCQVDTSPRDVANFTTTRAPTQEKAQYNGMYVLFNDDSDTSIGPILMIRRLKKDEMFGFEIDSNHVPFAFAGSDKMQLQPGRYRWQMTPDGGQMDVGKSGVTVIEVVVAAAVVVLIAIPIIIATRR